MVTRRFASVAAPRFASVAALRFASVAALRFASVAALLALAVAGCANNGSETGSAAPGPSGGTVSAASTSSGAPTSEPSGGLPTAGGAETLTGTVVAGVEPGCLLLQGAKGSHLLVFDDKALRTQAPEGAKITVTGTAKPGMMSTCQQGIPFIVTSVKPA